MELQETEIEQPAKPVLPLFILLALASALGVAVAVVLAGVAMLLAAPAYAGDGALLLEGRAGLVQAERLFVDCDSMEDGQTRVVEAYRNPSREPLAGVYVYRLPQHAVVERLSFTAGAPAVYPAVLTLRETAAVVERTAELAPGETLVVELQYRLKRSARYRSPS